MTDAETIAALVDRSVVGLTLFGEGRGEPIEGRIAIANVIRNRLTSPRAYRAEAATWKAICLAPNQFSCWLPSSGENYVSVLREATRIVTQIGIVDPVLLECLWLADGIMSRTLLDRSRGATFYCTTALYRAKPPDWVRSCRPLEAIGAHTFFVERAVA